MAELTALPYLQRRLPIVVVCNISETFYGFLKRTKDPLERQASIRGEQYRGDRSLLWLGAEKLVFVSHPIPHGPDLCRQFGYHGTRHLAPHSPSPALSLDLLRERRLLDALVAYAGPERTVQLIPYATTAEFLQLVATLRQEYGLTVLTPESPQPDALWLRDTIDSKIGFQVLVSRWVEEPDSYLPQSVACPDLQAAAAAACWFSQRGVPCLIKVDDGENGIGNRLILPGQFDTANAILAELGEDPLLQGQEITVQAFIASSEPLSPSLELFVPPMGEGEPQITYISQQIFDGPGDFCGVLLDRALRERAWYPVLAANGLEIARRLQEMEYVGHFDLDAVVDDQERPYLLEINSRRTGGTHVHEFGQFYFGPDYLQHVTLLSDDALPCPGIATYDELQVALADLLYPLGNDQWRGAIITVTSSLEAGEFGCVFVGPNATMVLALREEVRQRLAASPRLESARPG